MVISIALLVFGFVSRSIRLFENSSLAIHNAIRQPVSSFAQKVLMKLAGDSLRPSAQRCRQALVVNPSLATFLALKLNLGLFSSMLAEVYMILNPRVRSDEVEILTNFRSRTVVLVASTATMGHIEALVSPLEVVHKWNPWEPVGDWSNSVCVTPYRPYLVSGPWFHREAISAILTRLP